MLAIILKLLSILGIVLLILLGVGLITLLLILFFPIGYCIDGVKDPQTTRLKIKVRWLFGLLRGGVIYPRPGQLVVKLLWFTLFDSKAASENKSNKKNKLNKKKTVYSL